MAGGRSTSVSIVVEAAGDTPWEAFTEPAKLAAWLAPEGMRSEVHALDLRPSGELAMSLTYESEEGRATGKTTANTDTFRARFIDVVPGKLVQFTGTFDSEDVDLASRYYLADVVRLTQ